jgi:two-component system nitrogen regulation sensor histidine kinase NtrY
MRPVFSGISRFFKSNRMNRYRKSTTFLTESDRRRRKREIVIIAGILILLGVLTYLEHRLISFGGEFPISNTILMFILININVLLLLLLIFLVFRNLVKLLYDRRRKVMGSKLRTRLVVSYIGLTLFPTSVLFLFSVSYLASSIDIWFNVPVEQSLTNSIMIGRRLYGYLEENHSFYLKRIAYQVEVRKLFAPASRSELLRYFEVVRNNFHLHAVELYDKEAHRIVASAEDQPAGAALSPVEAGDLLRTRPGAHVRSYSERMAGGEIFRTVCTVPFTADPVSAKGFAAVAFFIPPDLNRSLSDVSRGYEQYQQIKLLKGPIKITYFIMISIVALLVVFCAVWFGFTLAKSISIPIKELAEGTRRVAEGDLSFEIAQVADDEIGSLVESFNKMTRDLRTGRNQLELSAQRLKMQNVEIDKRRRYMEIVLQNVSTGVVTLDGNGFVTTFNKSSERMLSTTADSVLDQHYRNLLSGRLLTLAEEVLESLSGGRENAVEFPLKMTVAGRPKSFLIRVNALRDEAGGSLGTVMIFDDLTDQEKAQRIAAWREVARRIAHEVKNPLTPIKLSAQRLRRKYAAKLDDPVFEECIEMIIDHVDLIRNLVNEFSKFARFPAANPVFCEIPPILEETLALYREGHPKIRFETEIPKAPPRLELDRRHIKQALINLIDNAVSALKEEGTIIIRILPDEEGDKVIIEMADDGPGIPDEDKTRLFEPYFSKKKSGMGLGLAIVNSIVADHNGRIRVRDNQPRGAVFVIELPVASR